MELAQYMYYGNAKTNKKEADLKGFCFIDVQRRLSLCNDKASSVSQTILLPVANVDALGFFLLLLCLLSFFPRSQFYVLWMDILV